MSSSSNSLASPAGLRARRGEDEACITVPADILVARKSGEKSPNQPDPRQIQACEVSDDLKFNTLAMRVSAQSSGKCATNRQGLPPIIFCDLRAFVAKSMAGQTIKDEVLQQSVVRVAAETCV